MFATLLRRIFPRPTHPTSPKTGDEGEALAAAFLSRRGIRVLERNWRCPLGELDIVGRADNVLVFVEVKSSRRLSSIAPELRVGPRKQRKLVALGRYYLKQRALDLPCRFDVIAVWWDNGQPQIRHLEDAFHTA